MGFLDVLGKIGKGALNLGTGGVSGSILDALGGVGGAGAKAASTSRMTQADLQAQIDALNNRSALDAATFNRELPGVQAGQVARGDVLSTMQDAPPTGDPRIDKFGGGGLRPSAFGPDSRHAGEALKKQALLSLMSGGGQFTPTRSQIPDSGIMEQIGGTMGAVGGIAGALEEARKLALPQKRPPLLTAAQPTGPFTNVRF